MALVHFAFQHKFTLPEARAQLERAIGQLQQQAAGLVHSTEWSDNNTRVTLKGTGFEVRVWVDEKSVNMEGDVPGWLKLLANSPLKLLEKTLETSFKRLPG